MDLTETALPAFTSIRSAAQRLKAPNDPAAWSGDKLESVFVAELEQAKVVSFDIFDTLLVRLVGHPRDVFLHLEGQPAFQKCNWPGPIEQIRAEAENMARQRLFRQQGTGEVVLVEIYEALCELTGLPKTAAAELAAAEEAVELQLCRPNPRLCALYRMATTRGKKVIAVSDTYHRRDCLVQLLAAIGVHVPAEDLFASSEHRVNKQSGQLFERVLKCCGTEPGQLLHVGDHPISDHDRPRQMGIKAIRHVHRPISDHPQPFHSRQAAKVQSLVRATSAFGSRCAERMDDFWWTLGYSVFGPLLTGFALWLHRGFVHSRTDRVFFLLRDGEVFLRVYEALWGPEAGAAVVRTLPSSRRAFILPILEISPDYALASLVAGVGRRPIGEYLARLNLPPESFEAEITAMGFKGASDMVDARQDRRVEELLRKPRVWEALRSRARQEKEWLIGYLRQEGVLEPGRTALVDLGWNGTIHKACALLLNDADIEAELTGCYLATFPEFRAFVPANLRVECYLTHLGQPQEAADLLRSFSSALECICSSASGSLLHFEFELATSRFAPVLQPNRTPPAQLAQMAAVHEGAVSFAVRFRDSAKHLRDCDDIPPQVAAENLLCLIKAPTKEEAMLLGGLRLGDDLGSTTAHAVARFDPDSAFAEELLADYKTTNWKQGLLNQPTVQAGLLRTLLWLMET